MNSVRTKASTFELEVPSELLVVTWGNLNDFERDVHDHKNTPKQILLQSERCKNIIVSDTMLMESFTERIFRHEYQTRNYLSDSTFL